MNEHPKSGTFARSAKGNAPGGNEFEIARLPEDLQIRVRDLQGRLGELEKENAVLRRSEQERMQSEDLLRKSYEDLELRIQGRTRELAASNRELLRRSEQLARLSSELTLAEQRERRRLAAYLHDHLQQLLVGAKIGLEVLHHRVRPERKSSVEQILDLILKTIKASRALTAELSPPILYEGGLSAALKWLARWMNENHGFKVVLHSDPQLDPEREDITVLLFQSIRELLLNAVKHSGVSKARVEMLPGESDFLCIRVSDQGTGFDPAGFWENSQETTGFGLLSIRERLTLLGGRLDVKSAPGKGTAFTLVAPSGKTAAGKASQSPDRKEAPDPESTATVCNTGGGRKIRLMLVDDHAVMRQGMSSLLSYHYDIDIVGEASDGEAAVDLARKVNPDVILMDISMPRMNGIEATRIIHSESPHIRIIGLSMFDAADQQSAMLAAGATAYCSKSGRTDDLMAAIRNEN